MTVVCPGKAEHRPLWRTLYDTMAQALWQTAQPLRQRTTTHNFGAPFMTRWRRLCGKRRNLYDNAQITAHTNFVPTNFCAHQPWTSRTGT